MAYQALARKYRSRTFDEVIGQEPIATTLANAIKTGRIHHGYLFTGTRGTGKTSMARILAKSLNCLDAPGPTVKPCLKCDACIAIAEGQDIDVVEIDAASNTGVDNIRELRSNTAYRPARSRFKIYIIDEVHMLSTGAFNALLKTLEEPPEHVKFILATTEIQKVPATIQSRCQRFNFRNIGPDDIAERLEKIVAAEGAQAEAAVLRRIARLANGSMRDALSILDQCLSVSPEKLTADVVDELLPPAQDEQVLEVLKLAAAGDAPAVLAKASAIFEQGRGLETFANDVLEAARALLHVRAGGADVASVDIPAAAREEYAALAQQFELSHYVQMIGMLEELRRNVRLSGAGRALTDALLIRLARMRQWSSVEQLLGQATPEPAPVDDEKKKAHREPPRPVSAPADFVRQLNAPMPQAGPPTEPVRSTRTAALAGVSETGRPSGPAASALGADAEPGLAEPGPQAPQGLAAASSPGTTAPGPEGRSRSARIASGEQAAPGSAASNGAPKAGLAGPSRSPSSRGDSSRESSAAREPAAARGDISAADRARIMQDPLVQEVIRLFEGVLVHVERPQATTEPDAGAGRPSAEES